MNYNPHKWLLIKITNNDKAYYKVFCCWYGGYLDSDSWRICSGITRIEENEYSYIFRSINGSEYVCSRNGYGISAYGLSIIKNMENEQNIDIFYKMPNINNIKKEINKL